MLQFISDEKLQKCVDFPLRSAPFTLMRYHIGIWPVDVNEMKLHYYISISFVYTLTFMNSMLFKDFSSLMMI